MAKQTNREKAIIALLSTDTVKEAAEECGLSVRTLYGYLADPAFVSEFRSHRRDLMDATLARLQKASDSATDTLRRNLNCGTPSAEIRAAQIILDSSLKGIELTDILERLEKLESEYQAK